MRIGDRSARMLPPCCKFSVMARHKKLILSQPIKEGLKTIKVRLDSRTVITLSRLDALAFWKQRYPNAEVIG